MLTTWALPRTRTAPRAIDARTAYQLVSMMRDVVQRGTGTAAKVLGREDVGGKTGSTNDHRDAWFSGFGGPYVTTVWVGRDDFRSLGYREYGGKAALPIWIDYMRVALKDKPITPNDPPEGMVQVSRNGATEWIKVEDLERKRDIARFLELAEEGEGVRIFIGSENQLFSLSGSSLVVSPYMNADRRIVGAVGVIGPTRLNYGRIVPIVDYTAQLVGRMISGRKG